MTALRPLSYAFGAFRLDAVERVLVYQDQPVSLTPKAIETLLALVDPEGYRACTHRPQPRHERPEMPCTTSPAD